MKTKIEKIEKNNCRSSCFLKIFKSFTFSFFKRVFFSVHCFKFLHIKIQIKPKPTLTRAHVEQTNSLFLNKIFNLKTTNFNSYKKDARNIFQTTKTALTKLQKYFLITKKYLKQCWRAPEVGPVFRHRLGKKTRACQRVGRPIRELLRPFFKSKQQN